MSGGRKSQYSTFAFTRVEIAKKASDLNIAPIIISFLGPNLSPKKPAGMRMREPKRVATPVIKPTAVIGVLSSECRYTTKNGIEKEKLAAERPREKAIFKISSFNMGSFGILFALFSGMFTAITDTLCKVWAWRKKSDYVDVLVIRWLWAIPFLLPLPASVGLNFSDVFSLPSEFFITVAVALPLEVTASFLYIFAITKGDISLVAPFQSLTPIFIPFVETLVLGERTTPLGFFGILCVAVGGWILTGGRAKIVLSKPVFAMILSALLYSITSVLGRKAVTLSSPYIFSPLYIILTTSLLLATAPFVKGIGTYKRKVKANMDIKDLKEYIRPSILKFSIGFSAGLLVIFHFLSLSLVQTSYMIPVKRSSILFSVILGYIVFRESEIRKRFVGAFFMLIGIFTIALET